ncbi:hypothetical protein [Pelagibacterium sp.]|uniref:hypothetical protein n=1 Tax=Pelagibacterium sp. TaxID=1967288 RepID=UPI003A8DF99A
MKNGRCYYHGGATPTGDDWHKRQWPNGTAKDAIHRMNQKLVKIEKARRERALRVKAMTTQQRARHDKWHKEHPSGSAKKRRADRSQRERDLEARKLLAKADQRPRQISSEEQRIADKIAELERRKLEIERGTISD